MSQDPAASPDYGKVLADIAALLTEARRGAVRSVNVILVATYWRIGKRIVEHELAGAGRAAYGEAVMARLAADLVTRFGRGFSQRNLFYMRQFFVEWRIVQTPSAKSVLRFCPASGPDALDLPAVVAESEPAEPQMSWSHYIRLMSIDNPRARAFYETEAIAGGWSLRQLDRQVSTQVFERTQAASRQRLHAHPALSAGPDTEEPPEAIVRDPYLLEFLNLKDEYSENDLEDALIRHLEWFLLELGAGFTFVARQKRIRVGRSWYRIDLLLYHRVLRCLVVIDLKTGAFSHADAGQMTLYLNYVRKHLTLPGEAEPVGIVLCSDKDEAVVEYAMGEMNARVFASKYLTSLPDTETLRREIVVAQAAVRERLTQAKRAAMPSLFGREA